MDANPVERRHFADSLIESRRRAWRIRHPDGLAMFYVASWLPLVASDRLPNSHGIWALRDFLPSELFNACTHIQARFKRLWR
jgi:hypothetical protein